MSKFSPPKGTRDFYPEDMKLQKYIFSSWEKTCRRYGFEYYDGPMFEHLNIYAEKSGDEIEKQLYTFKDKGGRDLALRPELTPTLARMVAAKGASLNFPLKWYSIPSLFRYERMQKGRLRQFYQLNMDILGIKSVSADAELIAAVYSMMRGLGFSDKDFAIRISDRNLLKEVLTLLGIGADKLPDLYTAIDKRHKMSRDDFFSKLKNILNSSSLADKVSELLSINSIDNLQNRYLDIPSLTNLSELFNLLRNYDMQETAVLDLGIVRGLAYYTGIVFEVFDRERNLRAIAGGGRYDKLVSLYGGPAIPATGFAAGDVVIGELLKEKKINTELSPRSCVYVVSLNRNDFSRAVNTAESIRKEGISAEFSLKPISVGKQMKKASSAGSLIALFTGGDEEKDGKIKLKNMVSGNETIINKADLITAVKKELYGST